jgi:hypothetical protein
MILIAWFFYAIFLIAVIAPVVIAVVPYAIIVSMRKWQWALGIAAIVVAWHLLVRYFLPYGGGAYLSNPIFTTVSALFAVVGAFARFATLAMEANGANWIVSLALHTSVYLLSTYVFVRYASSYWSS